MWYLHVCKPPVHDAWVATKTKKKLTDPDNPGEALYSFLEEEWEALGLTRGAWCRKANLPDSTVYRWKSGHLPDMRSLQIVADTLGRPMIEVLLAAGIVNPDEVNGQWIAPRQPVTLDDALRGDPMLNGETELVEAIRGIVKAWFAVRNGKTRAVHRKVSARRRPA